MAEVDSNGVVQMGAGATTGALAGTAIMPGIGTVIGAGLGLLGGFLGSKSNKKQLEESYRAQKEALQNSIQWRVADAKAAGIHPLYAVGAPSMSVSPMVMQDPLPRAIADSGQQIGNVIGSQMTTRDKLLSMVEYDNIMLQNRVNKAGARKAEAEAGIFEAQLEQMVHPTQNGLGIHNENEAVNAAGQVPNASIGTEFPPGTYSEALGQELGYYSVNPSKYTSGALRAPGLEARGREGMQEWRIRDGFYITMPYSDEGFGEQWSEMSPREKLVTILQNGKIYGEGYVRDAINYFMLGMEPTGKYQSKTREGWKPARPSGGRGREMMKRIFGQ